MDGLDTDKRVIFYNFCLFVISFACLLYLYIYIACVVTGVCKVLVCQCSVLACVGTSCVQLASRPLEY